MNPRDRTRLLTGLFLTLLVFVVILPLGYRWWTRPPAMQLNNLDCVQLLRTACSSQNRDYLDGVNRLVNNRMESGKMNEPEALAIQRILEMAEAEKWELADREAIKLEEAQLNRRR